MVWSSAGKVGNRSQQYQVVGRLVLSLAAVATLGLTQAVAQSDSASASADAGEWRHAGALSGEPGYPRDFEHFDYVNPDAPHGGEVKLIAYRGFDSLNLFLRKGTYAPGLPILYESLMTSPLDEDDISAQYGLLATEFRFPEDYSSATYRLNPDAKWHDGTPITAEDVIWSFETAKELSPLYNQYYANVVSVEETAPGEVLFTFDQAGNRELPHIVGQFPVLPKAWWSVERDGKRRIDQTRLDEYPLGSGPYRIADIEPGRSITYEAVDNHWAEEHPTQKGKNNFDRLTYEVFSDPNVRVQAFKRNLFDWLSVNSAKQWATAFEDFEALKNGRVIREEFPETTTPRIQAFVPNLRREKFQDRRVRRALNLAFDFETTQRTNFYGQYERADSFFDGSELASSGLPEGRELEILREVAAEHPDGVPESVFTEPYANPVAGNSRSLRDNLREADRLLREAGWELVDGKRVKDGEQLSIEYIEDSPLFEPIVLPWLNNLQRLGIATDFRFLDQSQAIERERSRDFDVLTKTWLQTLSPGNEQRDDWGSRAAGEAASDNTGGIQNPAIDTLIERIVTAPTRQELVATTRAMDRVLLHNDYVIPQWFSSTDRTLRWDKFAHPDPLPEFGPGFPTIWWSKDAEAREG